ncbi:hypothetical protein [Geodermatophilus sp. URMC 64]
MTFDASPPVAPPQRGGFLGFLTTLPGILTAAAAVITAATGGIYLTRGGEETRPDGGATYNINVDAAPVPEGSGQVDTAELTGGLAGVSVDSEVDALIADCANGDGGACQTLLDLLAQECSQGFGISCDVLYWVSEVGSPYEAYGATCGGRYDWTYAGACSEL